MKSYRWLLPYVLLLLIVVMLSGCIPKFKNPEDITLPSWKVDVSMPLAKQDVNFTELLSSSFQNENIIIDENTGFYNFFKSFVDDMPLFQLPDFAVFTEKLEFDPEPWVGSPSLNITYPFGALPTIIDIGELGDPDVILEPIQEVFKYSQKNGLYILAPFDHARFSDSPSNKLTLTLSTEEPLDLVTVRLLDRYVNEYNQWEEVEIASTEFILPSLPESTSIPATNYFATLDLAGKVIHGTMDMEITVQAHSSVGFASLTFDNLAQLDILEVFNFVLGDEGIDFAMPDIQIPPIKLLEQVPGLTHIKLKSGIIRVTQDTSASCQDHEMPFNISLAGLTISGLDDAGNPKTVSSQPDGQGSWIFDMAGLVLIPESEFSAEIGVSLLPEGVVYDIYEDATEQIKPYTYDFQCSLENLVIDYVAGDISEVVEDPSPETPDWDFRLDDGNTGIMALDFPEELRDFEIGFTKIDVYLKLVNETHLKGDFTITLKTYEDPEGKYLEDEASLTLNVLPREANEFDLSAEPLRTDFQKFIDIINSKPAYYEIIYGGGLGFDEADFKIQSGDYIAIPEARINIPIAIAVGAGGAEIKNIMPETYMYDPNQAQLATLMAEFIDQASLHIKYRNSSTLGFGARLKFKAEGHEPVEVETILYNRDEDEEYIEDELVLTVNKALFDILSCDTGYTVSADLIIPNNSDSARMMGLTENDKLSITVWLDGKINAHVPEEM